MDIFCAYHSYDHDNLAIFEVDVIASCSDSTFFFSLLFIDNKFVLFSSRFWCDASIVYSF